MHAINFRVSGWAKVASKASTKQKKPQNEISNARDVNLFLSSFKTTPCLLSTTCRDHRCCKYFHSKKDKRHNPYTKFYLPEDEGVSALVLMYHPHQFWTKLCDQSIKFDCPCGLYCAYAHENSQLRYSHQFRTKLCDQSIKFDCSCGLYCAYAHKNSQLRYSIVAKWEYFDIVASNTVNRRHIEALGNCIPAAQRVNLSKNQTSSASKIWSTTLHTMSSTAEYLFELPYDFWVCFLISASKEFLSFLKELALEEGLCQIVRRENHWGKGEYGIAIRGIKYAWENVIGKIAQSLFDLPHEFFVRDSKKFSNGIVNKLCELQGDMHETIF